MIACRHYFLFIVAAFVCTHDYAQTTKPEWGGPIIQTPNTPTLERLIKGQLDELIAIGTRRTPNALNIPDTYVAIRYDKDLKQVVEKELFSTRYRDDFQYAHNFKGNVFLFTRQFNRKQKMSTLYSIQIDPATLQVIDSNVIHQYKAKNRYWQPETTIKNSPDTSYILIFAEAPITFQPEPKIIYISVMDHHMNKLWDKEITLPYSNRYFVIECFDISNEGQIYVLGKHYDRGEVRERVRENGVSVPAYTYKILRIGKDDDQPATYVVNARNRFIHAIGLQFDANGNINLPGLYRNKVYGNVSGHFMAVLDKNSKQTAIQNMEPFPVNDLLKLMNKDWCADTDPQDPGLSYRFKVMGTNLRSDGSIDLLTEQNYSYEECEGSIFDSNRIRKSHTVYAADDILVINYKKDGRFFYTRIPKRQKENFSGENISFKWMKHGDELLLFYFDSESNVKKDLSKGADFPFSSRSAFVMATINDTGALQRQVVYTEKDIDMITPFNLCAVVDTNMLALFAIRGRLFGKTKFKFGRLKL